MGMFDYLVISDPTLRDQARCAAGHVLSESAGWQTKDLDCVMDTIFLHDQHVYVVRGGMLDDAKPEAPPGTPLTYTGAIRFYTSCDQCPETYWVLPPPRRTSFGPQTSRPRTEYVALVRRGQVLTIDPVQLETVEEDSLGMSVSGWIQSDARGNPITR